VCVWVNMLAILVSKYRLLFDVGPKYRDVSTEITEDQLIYWGWIEHL